MNRAAGLIRDDTCRAWMTTALDKRGWGTNLSAGPTLTLQGVPDFFFADDRWAEEIATIQRLFPNSARVLVTSFGLHGLSDRILNEGFHDYLVRPLTDALLDRILSLNAAPKTTKHPAVKPQLKTCFIDGIRERVKLFEQSGLAVKEFCAAHGISRSSAMNDLALARAIDKRLEATLRENTDHFPHASWLVAMLPLPAEARYKLCAELVELQKAGKAVNLKVVKTRVHSLLPTDEQQVLFRQPAGGAA